MPGLDSLRYYLPEVEEEITMPVPLNILFLAAEADPLVKIGDPTYLGFHERADAFYQRLILRRFNLSCLLLNNI